MWRGVDLQRSRTVVLAGTLKSQPLSASPLKRKSQPAFLFAPVGKSECCTAGDMAGRAWPSRGACRKRYNGLKGARRGGWEVYAVCIRRADGGKTATRGFWRAKNGEAERFRALIGRASVRFDRSRGICNGEKRSQKRAQAHEYEARRSARAARAGIGRSIMRRRERAGRESAAGLR